MSKQNRRITLPTLIDRVKPMSSLVLTDCLRATPSRTLAALALELSRRAKRTIRSGHATDHAVVLDDRILADIGVSRVESMHGGDGLPLEYRLAA